MHRSGAGKETISESFQLPRELLHYTYCYCTHQKLVFGEIRMELSQEWFDQKEVNLSICVFVLVLSSLTSTYRTALFKNCSTASKQRQRQATILSPFCATIVDTVGNLLTEWRRIVTWNVRCDFEELIREAFGANDVTSWLDNVHNVLDFSWFFHALKMLNVWFQRSKHLWFFGNRSWVDGASHPQS